MCAPVSRLPTGRHAALRVPGRSARERLHASRGSRRSRNAGARPRAQLLLRGFLAAGAGVELEAGMRARGVRTPETTTRAALKAVERLSKRVRREVERESYTALVCQLVFIEGDPLPADRVFTYTSV